MEPDTSVNEQLASLIALSAIPKIGPVLAKRLISYTGSAEAVFGEKERNLSKIPGIGEMLAREIGKARITDFALEELAFCKKNNISYIAYYNENYPHRLKQCEDGPLFFFYKGQECFNVPKIVSIVGTRKMTDYGQEMCESLIKTLRDHGHNMVIVSGLAYGADICAHKAAMKNNFPTVAVLGHGFRTLYPGQHAKYAREMIHEGALLTEFTSDIKPDRSYFVRRNRIIAGLSDVTIVIESAERGGALITAEIANSYNREVMAFPGRTTDTLSAGCNWLIRNHKAHMITDAVDLENLMGWDAAGNKPVQGMLFPVFSPEQETLVQLLRTGGETNIDQLAREAGMPVSQVSALLLNLEFEGVVKCNPGKMFRLIHP